MFLHDFQPQFCRRLEMSLFLFSSSVGFQTNWFQKSAGLSVLGLTPWCLAWFLVLVSVTLVDQDWKIRKNNVWKLCSEKRIDCTVGSRTWEFIYFFPGREPHDRSALWYKSTGNIGCKHWVVALNLFWKLTRSCFKAAMPQRKCHENEYQRPRNFVAFSLSPRVTPYSTVLQY